MSEPSFFNTEDLDGLTTAIEKLKVSIQKKTDEAETASLQANDENLSISLQSLARLNSALGKRAAMAKHIARLAGRVVEKLKEQKDARRSELTLQYSETQAVNKSEHKAKVEVMGLVPEIDEAFKISSLAKLLADEADDLTYRTDSFLKMGQSRLSLLKGDKQNGR